MIKTSLNQDLEKNLTDNITLLSLLRNIIFFFAIYFYFTGWLYTYYFFNHFGISLNSVDIPFFYFFVYSYSVIINWIWILIIIIFTIFIFYLFTSVCKFKKVFNFKWIPNLNKWIFIVVLILFFQLFFYLAKEEANKKARDIRIGYAKAITLVFKEDATKFYPKEFIDANNNGKLRLITQTKDRYFVLYQPKGEGTAIPRAATYDIAKTDILLVKIEIKEISKKGAEDE